MWTKAIRVSFFLKKKEKSRDGATKRGPMKQRSDTVMKYVGSQPILICQGIKCDTVEVALKSLDLAELHMHGCASQTQAYMDETIWV